MFMADVQITLLHDFRRVEVTSSFGVDMSEQPYEYVLHPLQTSRAALEFPVVSFAQAVLLLEKYRKLHSLVLSDVSAEIPDEQLHLNTFHTAAVVPLGEYSDSVFLAVDRECTHLVFV